MCKRRLWKWVSLPIGDLEWKFVYRGLRETIKEGSGNGVSLSMGTP